MPALKIHIEFEATGQIGNRLGQEAQKTRRMISQLTAKLDVLRQGDWAGQGAEKFYADMDDDVLPRLKRLAAALEASQQTANKIVSIMHAGEQEAARIMHTNETAIGLAGGAAGGSTAGGAAGSSASGAAGSSSGGAGATGAGSAGSPGSAGGAGGPGGGTPDWQKNNPLLVRDPKGLFSEQYLDDLTKSKVQGAESRALHDALNEFAKDPKHVSDATLQKIADARGRPLSEMKAGYQKFLQLKAQQEASGAEPVPDLMSLHSDFMGSTSQMRYGKMVGDAFGVDPVFGSMLNPTGGLVGPDNKSLNLDSTAVGYHGAVHDAAGYLYNYHGQTGPGYDYLGREGRDRSSPYSGQRAGIQYWRDKVGDDPTSRRAQGLAEVGVPVVDTYNAAESWVKDKFNSVKSIF